MPDKINSGGILNVSLPESGSVVEYRVSSDVPVKFDFFVTEVIFSCNGNDLILTGENGGAVVIKDYQTMAMEGHLPVFELKGGEQVPGDIYLFAFSDSESSVETAAGGGEVEGLNPDEVIPSEWLEPLLAPEEAGSEDSSSSLDGVDVLTYDALFSSVPVVDSSPVATLSGAEVGFTNTSVTHYSLADNFDPVNDAIQHLIDFPDYS